jgi:hypothetical protein
MRPAVGSAERVRAGVVGRLRERRGELVQAIVARVSDGAFGRIGMRDAEYVAGFPPAVAAAVEYALEGIERGRSGASRSRRRRWSRRVERRAPA